MRFKVPHTLVLLFFMILAAWLATMALPQGAYSMIEDAHGHSVVDPREYQTFEGEARRSISLWSVFTSIPVGFEKAQDIIFFVFIVGGAFAVLRATGAADALIGWLLRRFGRQPAWLVFGGMFVFAAGSSTIGMAEEYLPFVPLVIALCAGLGFDRVTAVGVLCVGYGVGYGVAATNPFTVIIAQNIAHLENYSGWWYRVALLVPFLGLGFLHVWRYAKRTRLDPSRSLVADVPWSGTPASKEAPPLTPVRIVALLLVVVLIALQIWGMKTHDWYLAEMGAMFIILSVVLGFLGRLGVDGTAKTFCEGAAELTGTALLIGFARTIQVILDEGQVTHTIVHGIASSLESTGPYVSAVAMFLVQCVMNLFIPSGSGQAYVTMPIMAPLADAVGVSKQVAVLAYQFGDGFMNIIVPTNAVLVGILGVAGIPFDRWLRFVVPFILQVIVLGSIALTVAVAIGLS
ncbi:MAG: TIGR00366 family protein [Planctomycetota bacterium]